MDASTHEGGREGLAARVADARRKAAALWAGLAPRERRLVAVAAIAVGLWLVWLLALQGPLRTLREGPERLARLDAQLQQMQQLAAQARDLQGRPTPPPEEAVRALQSATTQRLGDAARLTLAGDRATVVLQAVPSELLWYWLTEVRSGARVRPAEIKLARRDAASFDGTVVLVLPPPR